MVAKKKTRIKQAALTAAVQSRVEASAQIRRIGDLAREVKRLEAEMGDKQAAIEQEYNELADPLRAELAELTGGVQAYCEANREELTEGYKTKTVDFVTGIVKWRADPPSVRVTGVAAVLAYLKEKTALARFVRLKEEINKDAILNEADLFADGQVPGIKIMSGVEKIVIEPSDPELAGV